MSLITPKLFSEVADSVTCNGLGDCVSLLREPDAAYLLPTLSSVGASLAPPCFRFHTPLIEPDVRTTTAPHLDSTSNGQKTTYSSPPKISH